ncbi:protein YgfX [Fontimonas sp. SYSU GA230001]|uniref:protein YgfX n=1 Tax=Fontimonas sp. SYSU GA230001 TaxID=3142450 RepID=UPI0032B5564B
MSNSFVSTVDLSPRPSMRALRWAFVLHLIGFALLLAAQPPMLPMLACVLGLAGSWVWVRRHRALGFGPRAWTRMVWHAEGGWTLHRADGAQAQAELMPDSIVHPALLVLRFRLQDGASTARALLGDELPPELLRRLRARLSAE